MGDTIHLNRQQVLKDVEVIRSGGTIRTLGLVIRGLDYATQCLACSYVDMRSRVLHDTLMMNDVPFYHLTPPSGPHH
jgi:hypothetical protein